MPYTFGAAGTDDINHSTGVNLLASSGVNLVMGWWYPTAVGTDVLWSAGDTACVQMASSTLINLTTDNTTDGVWQGTFNALNNNEWAFLAFLWNGVNGTPVGAARMWQGTQDTAPVEVSVVQITAPAGNYVGSQAFTIGNKGTSATLAFKGDIANVSVQQDHGPSAMTPATLGTWTQNEADLIAQTYVQPVWLGDYSKIAEGGRGLAGNQQPAEWFDLNNGNPYGWGRGRFGADTFLATVNGATKTVTTGNPRPPISRPGWPLRRR